MLMEEHTGDLYIIRSNMELEEEPVKPDERYQYYASIGGEVMDMVHVVTLTDRTLNEL